MNRLWMTIGRPDLGRVLQPAGRDTGLAPSPRLRGRGSSLCGAGVIRAPGIRRCQDVDPPSTGIQLEVFEIKDEG